MIGGSRRIHADPAPDMPDNSRHNETAMAQSSSGRFAVYFFPDPGSRLAELGQAWLGRRVDEAVSASPPPLPGEIDVEIWRAVTEEPRRYGFHATLKAPFRLIDGVRHGELEAGIGALAADLQPFDLPALHVVDLAGFLALCTVQPSTAMDKLAERCVVDLDRFRAPLSAQDRARRRPDALPSRLRGHLDRFGYPYVLDAFVFHMTLTKRLDDATKALVLPVARQFMAPTCHMPQRIDRLSLFHQTGPDEPFRLLRQFPFGAGAT